MTLKFCANLSFMFQESKSLPERYSLAKSAGFKGVECAFPYEYSADELARAKTKADVVQVLINTYPGDWAKGERGFAAIPGKQQEFLSSLEQSIEYAKKLNCQKIHIMAGVTENETHEHLEVYRNNLKIAERILSDNKIIGLIEPINRYLLPNYFLNNYDKASSVLNEINSPNLKLQLDIFHMQHITGNLTKNIQLLFPMIGHIQIAQVPERHEPDSLGEINYQYIFSLLKRLGYNDWIGLEYSPATDTKSGLGWISRIT